MNKMREYIKGYPTRGSEVISFFEGRGGSNTFNENGCDDNKYYYIDADNNINSAQVESEIGKLLEVLSYRQELPRRVSVKEGRFDVTSLQLFDKLLVKDDSSPWRPDLFSHMTDNVLYPVNCIGGAYSYCIPYNEETSHLAGTEEDAPDYYHWWDD